MIRFAVASLLSLSLMACPVFAQGEEAPAGDPRAGDLLRDGGLPGPGIEGTWAASRQECFGPRMVTVTQRSISGPGMACAFDRVARNGGIVTFSGTCDRGQGPAPESVEAILVFDRLSFAFSRGGGNLVEALSRCLRTQ